jgi:hypothetical protein
MGDIVATVASPGHDIGIVTLENWFNQMKKKLQLATRFLKYIEKHHKDINIWSTAREREPMKVRAEVLLHTNSK